MKRGQPVIHPRAGKPGRQNEGRADRNQAFFEIGCILFSDSVDPARFRRGQSGVGNRIHIPNDSLRRQSKRQNSVCPAICGHKTGGYCQRIRNRSWVKLPPANQRYAVV